MKRALVCAVLGIVAVAALEGEVAKGDVTSDTFATDPIAGGRATVVGNASRFTYSAASHTVTAAYDSTLATAKLVFPLTSAITQNRSFTFSTTFTINSISNLDDVNSFVAPTGVSFGLFNSVTTGNDRNGGNAYDIGTVDYFPARTSFGPPSLGVTVIESAEAGTGYFDKVDFGYTTATSAPAALPDFLNTGVPISTTVSYDAPTHVLSATFSASKLMLGSGNPNSFTYTIDLDDAALIFDGVGFKGFNFDSFGLTLWNDSPSIAAGFDTPLSANLSFQGFTVTAAAPIPEPATLGMLAAGALALVSGRRRGR